MFHSYIYISSAKCMISSSNCSIIHGTPWLEMVDRCKVDIILGNLL